MSTHQQLIYHVVFSTKERRKLLREDRCETIYGYLAGIAHNLGGHALKIGGYDDHVHLLLRIPAKIAVSTFVGKLKANSSRHINDRAAALTVPFRWQDGFAAFTVSVSQEDRVLGYIELQREHHRTHTYQEEYLRLLKKHGIAYDPAHVWD